MTQPDSPEAAFAAAQAAMTAGDWDACFATIATTVAFVKERGGWRVSIFGR